MKDATRLIESGIMVPPVIHDNVLSSGHSGTAHHRARLKPIDMTAAAARNHPAARLAGYQTCWDARVFGVLKPYALLGGTWPRISGTHSTRTANGATRPIRSQVMFCNLGFRAEERKSVL